MLPLGTQILASYRGYVEDGSIVDEIGTIDLPQCMNIGDRVIPRNVSTALATMQPGEVRIVKAPYFTKGEKPVIATYEVRLAQILNIDAIEEEIIHGSECACGCHKLREALSHS